MNSQIADEILEELSSTLQRLDTQSAALLEFVKDKSIAKDDELAPYLERAAAASAVRWRATRVRMAHLLASAEKAEQQAAIAKQKAEQQAAGANQENDRDNSAAPQREHLGEKPAQADPHSHNERATKQVEKLPSGRLRSQAENERATQAEDQAQDQAKDRAGKRGEPAQKSSSRDDDQNANVEPAGQSHPSREHSQKKTGGVDQSSASKDGQSVATGSRKSSDSDSDEQHSDRHNVA
jgi:hypothetical protein